MKIIRYQSPSGEIAHAQQLPDGTATRLTGDLFGGFTPSNEVAQVGKLLAPLEPRAILCIGLNYRQHAAETNAPLPKYPVLFVKNPARRKTRATRSPCPAGCAATAWITNANLRWSSANPAGTRAARTPSITSSATPAPMT